jgi:hypothetical protein
LNIVSRDSILVMDSAGKILWANRLAHEIARLPPGGLLGFNYLQFTPPDTHGDLLKLHKKKLKGETVRFRIDLGGGRVLSTTSGPVRIGGKVYLFAVGRRAEGPPRGDEVLVGMLAAGELLNEKRQRVDLNSLLLSVLKEEARSLRGKPSLDPGNPPAVIVRPWPIRMALRGLLLQARAQAGHAAVSSGGRENQAWVRIVLSRLPAPGSPELALCRKILRDQGGRLLIRGRVVTLLLPAAG